DDEMNESDDDKSTPSLHRIKSLSLTSLFDDIDDDEHCDIIVTNLLFDELLVNDGNSITHLDSVSLRSHPVNRSKSSVSYDITKPRSIALTTRKKNPNNLDEYPLHRAVANGQIELVGKLLQETPFIYENDGIHWTPLHHAAWHGHHRIVELLLRSKRFSPNAVENFRATPLHFAALLGRVEVVRTLLHYPDINVHAINIDGKTALDRCKLNPKPDWQLCAQLIEEFMQRPPEKIKIRLTDGTTSELDLIAGSDTTCKQLYEQMIARLSLIPIELYSNVFGIWICSKSLRIQLKPDHKPVQHLFAWKKYAIPSLTSNDSTNSSLNNVNTNDEDPQLYWLRDSLLKIQAEQKIRHPYAIRLLFFEAYQNYIQSLYPCADDDAVEFAVIFMGITATNEQKSDISKLIKSHDNETLSILIPAEKLRRRGNHYWCKTILKKYKEFFNDDGLVHQYRLSSGGRSNRTREYEYDGRKITSVYIAINDFGLHLINRQTKSHECSFSYKQMTFTIGTGTLSTLEIYTKQSHNGTHFVSNNNNKDAHHTNNKTFFSFSSSATKHHSSEKTLQQQQRTSLHHILHTKQNFLIYHLMCNFAEEGQEERSRI
ncbi:unnamed protein product, partial [Didymodactylos carnosus]